MFPCQEPASGLTIGFDASTTGGGAWLQLPGQPQLAFFTYTSWTKGDEKSLGASIGECGSQALWEAYMLLVAIVTWKHHFVQHSGKLTIVGDAKGVLQAILLPRAKAPSVNRVIMELQMTLGASMHDLRGEHVWSEDNGVADALSRMAEGAEVPPECALARFTPPMRLSWAFLMGGNWSRPFVAWQ